MFGIDIDHHTGFCSLAVLHCHVLLELRRALDFFSRQRSQALGVRRRGGRSGDGWIDSCASWSGLFLILIRYSLELTTVSRDRGSLLWRDLKNQQ